MESKGNYEKLAVTDYLTKLPNRRGLYEFYSTLQPNERIHVMFLDIDNFKKVNDTYGHQMGDDLLVAVTKKIQEKVNGAFVSRMGGDEFVIVITGDIDEKEVLETAKRILNSVIELDIVVDVKAVISLSIGIILNQNSNNNLDDVLFKCDAAMYQAKKNGKNGYVTYDTIEKELNFKKSVELEMKDALRNGEFQVYLQPQVNIINSKVVGAEALVRWNHPKDGVRTPKKFLYLLEENGFIIEMDMNVFEQVCRQRQKWKDTPFGTIPIGVNMSKLHLYQPDFVKELLEITSKYDVQPSEIVIEITENMHKDNDEMMSTIVELKEAGFGTAIDDFGSGYSTLSLLRNIDVDQLKLDEEFINTCNNDRKSKVIVKNLITMAKDLHLDIIVEGVMNKAQERFLINSGCDVVQGYYYSKPLPIDEFEKFFEQHMQREDRIITYHFNDNLLDENGENEGNIVGDVKYGKGVLEDVGSLHISGGLPMKNIVYLPTDILGNDSFTISMWLKTENFNNWTSVIFAQSENGFLSIMPYAWERVPMFRVKDDWDENGWDDVLGKEIQDKEWVHLCVTYNSKTTLARIFQNGVLTGKRDNMFQLSHYKMMVLGGDYFQTSYEGLISELYICNYAKTQVEVKDMYDSYLNNPKFLGIKPRDWMLKA